MPGSVGPNRGATGTSGVSGRSGYSGTSGFSGRSGFSGTGTSGFSGASGAGGGASYLVYTALLTQSGTDAPVATVLENTLGGTVVWSYLDIGRYTATLSGAFTSAKTVVLFNYNYIGTENARTSGSSRATDNTVNLVTFDTGGNPADAIMTGATIEIRVFP